MASKKTAKNAPKAPSKMNAEECLAELATMADTVDFGGATFTKETALKDLRNAVKSGREALRDAAAAAPAAGDNLGSAELTGDEDSVDIVRGEVYVRTFSVDEHGEEFLDLAEQFVAKHEGSSIVPSDSIPQVTVRWEESDKETGVVRPKYRKFVGVSGEVKREALTLSNELRGQVLAK